jgi:DNA-binding MarR family transcriptional regulator
MQSLQPATDGAVSPDRCARELLSGAPAIMRFLRDQMRSNRQAELTVPQFRALIFISQNEKPSLSAMAEHLGLSLPATSRMVEVLVKRGLVERRARRADRRCISLSLTAPGRAALRVALQAAQTALARRFDALSARELALVSRALRVLGLVFGPESSRMDALSKRRTRLLDGAPT